MWQAIAVALLLLASAEGAALVVLALVIRSMQRELLRRSAPTPPRRPVGFRPPG